MTHPTGISSRTNRSINLRDLLFLIADPNAYLCTIVHSILRGFGATKVTEARECTHALQALSDQKIDILICDALLPPYGGLKLTQAVRRNTKTENRTVPILVMAGDSRATTIENARDAGANMVIAKPISPAQLYDRLLWIAFNPRQFVDTPNYFGPDRRFKIEGYPNGVGRRKGDTAVEIGEATGPSLSQSDIDHLLNSARAG